MKTGVNVWNMHPCACHGLLKCTSTYPSACRGWLKFIQLLIFPQSRWKPHDGHRGQLVMHVPRVSYMDVRTSVTQCCPYAHAVSIGLLLLQLLQCLEQVHAGVRVSTSNCDQVQSLATVSQASTSQHVHHAARHDQAIGDYWSPLVAIIDATFGSTRTCADGATSTPRPALNWSLFSLLPNLDWIHWPSGDGRWRKRSHLFRLVDRLH